MIKKIFCENCDSDFTIRSVCENEIKFCPFCGNNVDDEWNVSDELEV